MQYATELLQYVINKSTDINTTTHKMPKTCQRFSKSLACLRGTPGLWRTPFERHCFRENA